jgi:hypothetical protein
LVVVRGFEFLVTGTLPFRGEEEEKQSKLKGERDLVPSALE